VVHGTTGLVVEEPRRPERVAAAIDHLLADAGLRQRMGQAAQRRAVRDFSYDGLASRLQEALGTVVS
jgi:glycosyltransferase involved in cell wall biosynthesis